MTSRSRGGNPTSRLSVLAALDRPNSGWPQAYIREFVGRSKSQVKVIVDELIAEGDIVEVWASRAKGGSRLYALTARGRKKARQSTRDQEVAA